MKRNKTFRILHSAFILACSLTAACGAEGTLVKVPEGTVVEASALPAAPVFLRNLNETELLEVYRDAAMHGSPKAMFAMACLSNRRIHPWSGRCRTSMPP